MLESIFIATDGRSAKTKSTNVAKKISNASTDINSAKKELNNVDYVDLSYEIDQLESMYKKNNNQASEFETFASTLESMVNDYISVDKECATRIKSNGKNHRKNTGLAKNLALATICASFDKIGNKLGDIADNVKDWAESVVDAIVDGVTNLVDKIVTSVIEDWESYFQLAEGLIQIITSVGVLSAAIAAAATGGGIALAIPALIASITSLYMGIDKLVSSVLDISNIGNIEGFEKFETDGSTITQIWAGNNEYFNIGYEVVDLVAGLFTGKVLTELISPENTKYLLKLFGNSNYADKVLDFLKYVNKASDLGDKVGDVETLIGVTSPLLNKDKDIAASLNGVVDYGCNSATSSISDKIYDKFTTDLVGEMLISKNLYGVLS